MSVSIAMRVSCVAILVWVVRPVLAEDGSWPTFTDETATRLIADRSVGVNDHEEKDYAWGDVDQDGDIDLVCVRKEPWNTPGRFRNVLFMNEGVAEGHSIDGVLVDRTAKYATDSTDGGEGLLDLTADRDVALVDVNRDGWLDIVTATTYGQDQPKRISHPRVYINKGSVDGVWQGFRYEESRTPTMPIVPNFCGIGFGDVTGDGSPDLYFVDYNNDLEDRLWINVGSGFYIDQSEARMTYQMRESDFGVHAVIADMNGDGVNDVVKDRASSNSTPPLRITISYNNQANEGFFNEFDIIYSGNPYHVEVGDLNDDGMLDIVIEDDGTDRYYLNLGNGGDGLANFIGFTFPSGGDSFGGNIVIRDLNNDGHNDVLICDVDVDCCGCSRHMRIWRNNGNVPFVGFQEETGSIPEGARTGTHDVAVFDINGDNWLDLVIGTCTGTSVWIAQPPCPPGDLDGDGVVGASDLLILLVHWGPCADCDDCIADIDGNCTVGASDLLILLTNWS
ncbi:MAG: VCBS repeat-containing protein [Phycisphaerales bacterium]